MENYPFSSRIGLNIFNVYRAIFAIILGASPEMVATVLPKSITTPIAMEVASHLGGIPAVTAVGVVVAGLQGSVFGYLILKKLGLNNKKRLAYLLVQFLTH